MPMQTVHTYDENMGYEWIELNKLSDYSLRKEEEMA